MGPWGQDTVWAGTSWGVLNVSLCASGAQLELDIIANYKIAKFCFFLQFFCSHHAEILLNGPLFFSGMFYSATDMKLSYKP